MAGVGDPDRLAVLDDVGEDPDRRHAWLVMPADTRDSRHDLADQLELLSQYFCGQGAQSRHNAPWLRQTRDKAGGKRIAARRHDYPCQSIFG